MKRLVVCSIMTLAVLAVVAHEPQQKFSPEKFQAELEQFITTEAGLSQEEAARFFPVYREMQQKQRAVYDQMKDIGKMKPQQETACMKAVEKRDELELQLKKIQQTYHTKFFSILSASKVYDIIKAEDRFHRRAFKNWGKGHQHNIGQH